MVPRAAFIVPGSIDAATGGSRYDRMMVDGLRRRGWRVDVHELQGGYPLPSPADVQAADDAMASVPDRIPVVVDGLVLSAIPAVIAKHRERIGIAVIVHLPVAADVTLDPARLPAVERAERDALAATRAIIVTGQGTAGWLGRYDIPRDRIRVIEPGTRPQSTRPQKTWRPGSAGRAPNHTVRILCVATIQPGKGHHVLFEALRENLDLDWQLTCAGSLTRDPLTADRVRSLAVSLGLADRVTFTGELDEATLSTRYDESDVFALATLQETYGMAVAEAIAHGLPVVSTECGAIASLVGPDAGLLVGPGDKGALAFALRQVLGDECLRTQLTEGARRRRERLPSPEQAVEQLEAVLRELNVDD